MKPAGMPTELTSDPGGVSLIEKVRAKGHSEARLPHRLDRMTRGWVVVALTRESIAFHNEEVRRGAWAKWYLARIAALRNPGEILGEHRAYLRTVGHRAEIVRAGGKPAVMEVLDCAPAPQRSSQAHVLIRLRTGRFHQIRAMLADRGVPIAGDDLYGGAVPESRTSPRPYLEHAAIRFRPFGASVPRVLFDPDDAGREPVDPRLLKSLLQLTIGSLDEETK